MIRIKKLRLYRQLVFALMVGSLSGQFCIADGRTMGETIIYELIKTSTTKTELANQPSYIRNQLEAVQKAANGKKQTTQLKLSVDQIEADGNAHFKGSFTRTFEGLSSAVASAYAAAQTCEGTLTVEGQVIPAFDQSQNAVLNSHVRNSPEEAQNIHGYEMQRSFANFNTFVIGLSKHPQLKPETPGASSRLTA